MNGAPAKLYCIRHGETAWSLSGQHTGHTDLPLTERGEQQAGRLVPWLGAISFTHVFTSPLLRARRTCELAGFGPAAVIETALAEWNYGDYEGKLSTDIRKVRPGWSAFRDGCPGGEMPEQISARADGLIRQLCTLQGSIALFSHGAFAAVLAVRWLGLPVAEGVHFPLGPASLAILGYGTGHPETRAINLWNATPCPLSPDPN
jgi:broad specificity phosphatase PhoE